jgi:hypothetical protein
MLYLKSISLKRCRLQYVDFSDCSFDKLKRLNLGTCVCQSACNMLEGVRLPPKLNQL